MKFAVVVALSCTLFAYCTGDDLTEKIAAQVDSCLKESNAKPELVEKLVKNSEYPEDNSLKCFIKCVYTKTGIMADSGSFNADELKKTLDANQSPDLVNKCKDLKGKDNCDTAFQVAKCMDGK